MIGTGFYDLLEKYWSYMGEEFRSHYENVKAFNSLSAADRGWFIVTVLLAHCFKAIS